eukprot:CFRG6603T1
MHISPHTAFRAYHKLYHTQCPLVVAGSLPTTSRVVVKAPWVYAHASRRRLNSSYIPSRTSKPKNEPSGNTNRNKLRADRTGGLGQIGGINRSKQHGVGHQEEVVKWLYELDLSEEDVLGSNHSTLSPALSATTKANAMAGEKRTSSLGRCNYPDPLNIVSTTKLSAYTVDVRAALDRQDWQKLEQLIDNMYHMCGKYNSEGAVLIIARAHEMDYDQANRVARKLWQAMRWTRVTFNSDEDSWQSISKLMKLFNDLKRYEVTPNIFNWATQWKGSKFPGPPSVDTYNCLLECSSYHKGSEILVFSVLNEMKAEGVKYNEMTLIHALRDCGKRKRGDQALSLFYTTKSTVHATTRLHNECMRAIIHGRELKPDHPDSKQVLNMYNDMLHQVRKNIKAKLYPDVDTYKILFPATDLDGHDYLWRHIMRKRVLLDYDFLETRLFRILRHPAKKHISMHERAVKVLHTVKEAQTIGYFGKEPKVYGEERKHFALANFRIMQAKSLLEDLQGVLDMYEDMTVKGIALKSEIIALVLKTQIRARRLDDMNEVLQRFFLSGEDGCVHLCKAISDMCEAFARERGNHAGIAMWRKHQGNLTGCLPAIVRTKMRFTAIDALLCDEITSSDMSRSTNRYGDQLKTMGSPERRSHSLSKYKMTEQHTQGVTALLDDILGQRTDSETNCSENDKTVKLVK